MHAAHTGAHPALARCRHPTPLLSRYRCTTPTQVHILRQHDLDSIVTQFPSMAAPLRRAAIRIAVRREFVREVWNSPPPTLPFPQVETALLPFPQAHAASAAIRKARPKCGITHAFSSEYVIRSVATGEGYDTAHPTTSLGYNTAGAPPGAGGEGDVQACATAAAQDVAKAGQYAKKRSVLAELQPVRCMHVLVYAEAHAPMWAYTNPRHLYMAGARRAAAAVCYCLLLSVTGRCTPSCSG